MNTQTLVEVLLRGGMLTILVVSLDVLFGLAGRLSLAQGGLYGVGAYALALLTTKQGVPFVLALLCGMTVAALIAAVVAVIASRTSYFYLAIATLAVEVLLIEFMRNLTWTGGSSGVFGISRLSIGGTLSDAQMAAVVCIAAAVVLAVDWWLSLRFLGLRLRGVKEDEELMESYGYSVSSVVVRAFAISGALCGLAGALYATSYGYIEPGTFGVQTSFDILIAFIVGGRGPLGAVLGAFFFAIVEKLLTIPNLPGELAGTVPQVVYGVVLILAIAFMPGGASGLVEKWARWLRSKRPPGDAARAAA